MRNQQRISKQVVVFLVAALGLAGILVFHGLPLASQEKDADFQPRRVLGPLPPITDFPVKTVREAGVSLNPSELVIGVTVGKESRAYPINMLTGPEREILNDQLGGRTIAATW